MVESWWSHGTDLVSVVSVERALVNNPHVDRLLVQLLHPELLPPLESLDNTVDGLLCLLPRLIENMFPKPDIETLRNIWPFRRIFPTTNLITYSSLDLSLSKSSVRMPEDPNSCNLVIALCRTFSSSFEVGGSFSIPKSKRMRYRDTFN